MRDPEPVIELEPKSPFRWKVFLAIAFLWGAVLALAVELKSNVLRMVWPALLFVLVLYLAVCTFVLLKRRK
jgi:hypothetical protein